MELYVNIKFWNNDVPIQNNQVNESDQYIILSVQVMPLDGLHPHHSDNFCLPNCNVNWWVLNAIG